MDALLVTIIGALLAMLFTTLGGWWKSRADANGWKISYEREKERADRLQNTADRKDQAVEIATKTAEALHALMQKSGGGS